MSTASPENAAIARNYAYLLVGSVFFPFMIAAHLTARKKRNEPGGMGTSHYRLQYRTTSLALSAAIILLAISAAMIFHFQYVSPLQQAREQIWLIIPLNVGKVIFLWVVIRCIRGLYLAGASRQIQNPATYWIWP
ncbi:hypothetical protein [Rhizobium sp. 11_C7_N12_5]|uniref:hypothetical protein n=1 Tax=Rhizobium sp. 11_C7_N12_5 TaxID=3240770 RepID=UPI003F291BE4